MRHDPHTLVEGCLIAGFGDGRERRLHLHPGRVHPRARGAADRHRRVLRRGAARGGTPPGSGWDFDLYLHHGAGAYICGEETALLESLEGRKGMPRLKPPFPANTGLYGCPTTVNNVESIAVVPTILRRGHGWFASFGRPNNAGTKVFAISGHVERPCVVEDAMSIPLQGAAGEALRRGARRLEEPQGGDPRRLVGAAAAGERLRRLPDGLRLAARGRGRASAPRR